ncbi:MAG: hypothetical protein IT169_13200 [Bryobacterales bacterium]|nr:hypothetical protein [Bryobacterales bacterium]
MLPFYRLRITGGSSRGFGTRQRGVALRRKNWIHLGNKQAGPRVAAILSIAETRKRQGLPLRDYLLAIPPGMADRKHQDAKNLTPTRWKQHHA